MPLLKFDVVTAAAAAGTAHGDCDCFCRNIERMSAAVVHWRLPDDLKTTLPCAGVYMLWHNRQHA